MARAKKVAAKVGSWIPVAPAEASNSPIPPGKPVKKETKEYAVSMKIVAPGHAPWLRVTSQKTGLPVYLPLPIRLIKEAAGGGCLVRGAHGDESTAKESAAQVLDMLGGYPLGDASEWSRTSFELAT